MTEALGLLLVAAVALAASLRILRECERAVVFRLGCSSTSTCARERQS